MVPPGADVAIVELAAGASSATCTGQMPSVSMLTMAAGVEKDQDGYLTVAPGAIEA